MKKKKRLFLDSYFDFDSIFPQEYFEVMLQELSEQWIIYYVDSQGKEKAYGPYPEPELMEQITLSPFFFEQIVFVYHLIEHSDPDLRDLGIRLLKRLAQK